LACKANPYKPIAVHPDLRETNSCEQNAEARSPASASPKAAAWSGGEEPSGMIHEILSSDVEFAKGMLSSSHSDVEILAYLTSRGIEPAKAANLLDDLRHGRKPSAELAFVLGLGRYPATDRPRSAGAEVPLTLEARRRHPHRRRSHRHYGVPWWFILLALIFIVALGYAFFEMGSDASSESINAVKHELSPPSGK
jgi:hypothetical protein